MFPIYGNTPITRNKKLDSRVEQLMIKAIPKKPPIFIRGFLGAIGEKAIFNLCAVNCLIKLKNAQNKDDDEKKQLKCMNYCDITFKF
jgi:hypothetical protein